MENFIPQSLQRYCNILALSACLAVIQPVDAAQVSATWVGGTSNWNTSGNWSPMNVPNNNVTDTYNVFIDSDGGTASSVSLNTNAAIDNLTVDSGDSLGINNVQTLTVGNSTLGTITNNGAINLNSVGSATRLRLDGDVTLNGTGLLTLGSGAANSINAVTNTDRLTNNSTIQGRGNIGANVMALTNNGLVDANVSGLTLFIDPSASGAINTGTLRASSGGILQLNAGVFDNSSGSIDVQTGSSVLTSSGTEIQGGTLQATGSGFFDLKTGTTLDGVTVTGTGTVEHKNVQTVTIENGLTNHSTWNMNAAASATTLLFSGTQTLGGSGKIVMSDSTANRIRSVLDGQVLTIDQGVEGAGNLGLDTGGMVNNGGIEATGASALTIDPDNSDSFINNSTLVASGSGGLLLAAGLFDNNTSIDVLAGSRLVTSSGTEIQGGTLQASGSGFFDLKTGTTLDGVTVTGTGTVEHKNVQTVTIENGLTNHSTWNMNAAASATTLLFSGTQTLGGSGKIVMSDSTANRIRSALDGQVLTIDQDIEGAGNLGLDTGGMVNNGGIEATGASALTIDPDNSDSFINNSTLVASGSGGLLLAAGLFDNNSSIDVLAGSRLVTSSGTEIQGGTLQATGSGFFDLKTGTTLDGVTVTGTGTVEHKNVQTVTIENGLTNHSTWNMNAAASATTLLFSGTQTLGGSGKIVMSDSTANRIRSVLDGQVLTIDQGVEGAGNLGLDTGGMVNNGGIEATGASALTIDPDNSDSFINNSTLVASGSGGLLLAAGLFDNNTSIDVLAGSRLVTSSGTEIQGGTLQASGSGFFDLKTGTTLDGVTVTGTGTVEHKNVQTVTIENGLTNHSTWNMNSTGSVTSLTVDGNQTLGGTGSLVMNTSIQNRISGSSTLVQGTGHTIEGTGMILTALDNDGLVHANQGTTTATSGIILTTNAKINDGTMKASNGAALNVNVNVSGTGQWIADGGIIRLANGINVTTTGDIVVQNGGELELNNASMSGDNLSLTGSGSVIDINSTVSLSGNLSFDLTAEGDWLWGGSSVLEMVGGQGATSGDFSNWASLEIGGFDIGTDPANHVGAPAGFSSNFELNWLKIGAGAHVFLADLLNNGNRNGSFGAAEALYVDTLELVAGSQLNINGLNLYYNTLIGSTGQIINTVVPIPAAVWLMGSGLLCLIGLGRRRNGRVA